MTPAPNLQELIDAVREDAASEDALDQLTQAARLASQLEETNDALLSHFVDRCRRSGRSWSEISTALGVSKQAVHKRFSLSGPPSLDRFTPRAHKVVALAGEEGRARGSGVDGGVLLLALVDARESLAGQVLAEAGIARDACAARLAELPAPDAAAAGEHAFQPDAVEALRASVEEALLLGHNYVGTEHLLLAVLRDPDGRAARAAAALGLDYGRAKAAVVAKLEELAKPGIVAKLTKRR